MIEWRIVKDELDRWRETIGGDIVDAIIDNLQEEVPDEVIGTNEQTDWKDEMYAEAVQTEPKGEDYDYQRAVEDMEYAMHYEPTYNLEDGSM